jgi:hypothetical protein
VDRASRICSALVVALLMGPITLTAAAAPAGKPDTAGGAVAHQQTASRVGSRHEARTDPGMTYRWDKPGGVQSAAALLPDEPTNPRQTMVRIAQVSVMIGLTALGLAITFTSLFSDMKRRRRVVYRPRGR